MIKQHIKQKRAIMINALVATVSIIMIIVARHFDWSYNVQLIFVLAMLYGLPNAISGYVKRLEWKEKQRKVREEILNK